MRCGRWQAARIMLCAALLCALARMAVSTRHLASDDGETPDPTCKCPAVAGPPLCATNGKVYLSECGMKCAQTKLRGACGKRDQAECMAACEALTIPSPHDDDVRCYNLFQPVCGKNGGIFNNDCEAKARGVEVHSTCPDDVEQCTRDCFEAAGDYRPFIESPDPPACTCDDEKAPVCGMSGAIYDNRCMAEQCFDDAWRFDCLPTKDHPPTEDGEDSDYVFAMDVCYSTCAAASCVDSCPSEQQQPVCTSSGSLRKSQCEADCNQEGVRFTCPEGLDDAQCAQRCKCVADCRPPPYDYTYSVGKAAAALSRYRPLPVCGASGQMWNSQCELECAADTPCTPETGPDVCTWDGSFRTECYAKCNGLEVVGGVTCPAGFEDPAVCQQLCSEAAKEYRCQQAQCDPEEYSPVCTTDGTVLNSTCLAGCHNMVEEWRVKCSSDPAQAQKCADRCSMAANGTLCAHCADLPYDPVCSMYGTFYRTRCEAECEGAQVNEKVQCSTDEELAPACSAQCSRVVYVDEQCPDCDPDEYHPVCATDGQHYRSACLAKCALAQINYLVLCDQEDPSTEPECADRCRRAANPPPYEHDCNCSEPSEEDAPVCIYSGEVMKNSCAAQCAGLPVRLVCQDLEDCAAVCKREAASGQKCPCDMTSQPVCGSDGNVYPNNCLLNCEAQSKSSALFRWPTRFFNCTDTYMNTSASDCALRCKWRIMPAKDRPDVTSQDPCTKCKAISAVAKVCGMSGKVHNHQCYADCNRDKVRWACADRTDCEGACLAAAEADKILPGGCDCVELNQPVCAASRIIHPNSCTAVCKGDAPLWECGKLSREQCRTVCSAGLFMKWPQAVVVRRPAAGSCQCAKAPAAPVCAASGAVYRNPCLLQCATATKLWDCGQRKNCAADCVVAAAAKPALCIAGSKPVCATNGMVVANSCALKAAKLKKRWDCGKRKHCARDCLAASKPVVVTCPKMGKGFCATNGSVFPNECLLKQANASKRFECAGRFDCRGDCAVAASPQKFCGCVPDFAPVCARNGRVFTNACLASCAKRFVRWPCGKRGANCPKLCRTAAGKP